MTRTAKTAIYKELRTMAIATYEAIVAIKGHKRFYGMGGFYVRTSSVDDNLYNINFTVGVTYDTHSIEVIRECVDKIFEGSVYEVTKVQKKHRQFEGVIIMIQVRR